MANKVPKAGRYFLIILNIFISIGFAIYRDLIELRPGRGDMPIDIHQKDKIARKVPF
ncbi:MAG: hypothetical protein MPW16_14705 [Candidatus Manganitrophus sp.]|nr:MAG: hypothetical protein MPW16_14705 [Candidatus Manganitrophus sp.]